MNDLEKNKTRLRDFGGRGYKIVETNISLRQTNNCNTAYDKNSNAKESDLVNRIYEIINQTNGAVLVNTIYSDSEDLGLHFTLTKEFFTPNGQMTEIVSTSLVSGSNAFFEIADMLRMIKDNEIIINNVSSDLNQSI